ncbi:MAG TPA: peptide chain release factor N(5)-glutamine methyltransferase [Clostridiales bacterium]|nr:peptide chain release factor N(5)-glutamine methyltransferase [Clostridiales bacterium]
MPPGLMDVLNAGQKLLQKKGVESARLESEMLMSHVLGCQRHQLYIMGNRPLDLKQTEAYEALLHRRLQGEPIQYIIGVREFMGLNFHVDKRVLIPRWETELLVEYVINRVKDYSGPLHILDLGTGSGAIAVSLASYLSQAWITAVDIKEDALQAAADNAKLNKVENRIEFLKGDFFTPLELSLYSEYFDVIVSNPPYIPTKEIEKLMTEVKDYEPITALDGGADGLDCYRRIAAGAWQYLKENGFIALEIGYDQSKPVQEIFLSKAYHVAEVRKDLSGIDRIAVFCKRQGV